MLSEDVEQQVGAAVEAVLQRAPAAVDQVWVARKEAVHETDVNQLIVFLKPEVTAISQGVRLERILDTLRSLLDRHSVEVGAVRVVNGRFLERARLMRKHYGVINTISRLGEEAVSDQARVALHQQFHPSGGDILGGHQFLAEYPQFTAYALHVLFANLENVKLAPGTYACAASMEARKVVILNGFHPFQLQRLTDPGAVLVLLEGRTTTPWRVLRREFAGATDPRAAAAGSFRRTLLDRADEFGVPHVSQNYNGLHVSAGPLEGMVEVRRFFGDADEELPIDATSFGRLLQDTGIEPDAIAWLAENPILKVGDRLVSAFDLTEEMDAVDAADALRAATGY